MKLCRTCNTEKGFFDFGKRKASPDGLSPKCKSCMSDYDRARNKNPERILARKMYAKTDAGKIKTAEAKARWAKNHKKEVYESTKRYRQKNPNKCKAHGKVAYEVKLGNLTPRPCEVCNSINNINAHHDDYSKPLDVRWLCSAHHSQWHAEHGEALNP